MRICYVQNTAQKTYIDVWFKSLRDPYMLSSAAATFMQFFVQLKVCTFRKIISNCQEDIKNGASYVTLWNWAAILLKIYSDGVQVRKSTNSLKQNT